MLPCSSLLARIPYMGVQTRFGPWTGYEIQEMRRMIEEHEESFGIFHPEVNYIDLVDYIFIEHYVETYRPTVSLRMMLSFVPEEKRSAERDIELMRQFSMWYGGEAREE